MSIPPSIILQNGTDTDAGTDWQFYNDTGNGSLLIGSRANTSIFTTRATFLSNGYLTLGSGITSNGNSIITSTGDTTLSIIANSTATNAWPTLDLIRQNTSPAFSIDNYVDWRISNRGGILQFIYGSNSTATTRLSLESSGASSISGGLIVNNGLTANNGLTSSSSFSASSDSSFSGVCNFYSNLFVNARIGVGTSNPRVALHVASSDSWYQQENYFAYRGPSASNGSTTNTPTNVSIYAAGRILTASEVNVISDQRSKTNIEVLDLDKCMKFVTNVVPKCFEYKSEPGSTMLGWIAQDIIKEGFDELIMVCKEDIDEHTDEDGFVSEKDRLYTLSRTQIIALLHGSMKRVVSRLEDAEAENKEMKQQLADLLVRITSLEQK